MKYLAIDHGEKKIGLAIGDSETKIASPYKILVNGINLLANIREIIHREEIDKIVVGVPISLKSTSSKQTKNVLNFISQLRNNIDLEIIEQDERYSSSYAKNLLKEMKVKHMDDDVAAMLILQSYLDKQFR